MADLLRRMPWIGRALFLVSMCVVSAAAQCNVIVKGTRFVYAADQQNMTVQLSNPDDSPALVQSWVDTGDASATPESSKAPFVVLPPITRINAHQGQALRVIFTGEASALPSDRASVFWLNVLDVPASGPAAGTNPQVNQNILKFAIRSRLKIFFRPSGLKGRPQNAPRKLRWHIANRATQTLIVVDNPTPFYVTVVSLASAFDQKNVLSRPRMIAPKSQQRWIVAAPNGDLRQQLAFQAIDDYGAVRRFKTKIDGDGPGR